jgi:hypothetical protein
VPDDRRRKRSDTPSRPCESEASETRPPLRRCASRAAQFLPGSGRRADLWGVGVGVGVGRAEDSMVKRGIPTEYRGVQMRSRAEARWAALFDEWGWRWLYEPIDLDGYIPDFLVTRGKEQVLIEVKGDVTQLEELAQHRGKIDRSGWTGTVLLLGATPLNEVLGEVRVLGKWSTLFAPENTATALARAGNATQWRGKQTGLILTPEPEESEPAIALSTPTIYLAGKISKNDWRSVLFPKLSDAWTGGPWPIYRKVILGKYHYSGPFFLSCDHGCNHQPQSHAAADTECQTVSVHDSVRFFIAEQCNAAIRKSDILFAWLNDLTAYGTLVEIGTAIGLGKKVVLAHLPGALPMSASPHPEQASQTADSMTPCQQPLAELWFAFKSVSVYEKGCVLEASDPVAALSAYMRNYELENRSGSAQ